MSQVEEWRAVQGWPYEVSSLGRVRRVAGSQRCSRGHRYRKLRCDKNGYLFVDLSKGNKTKRHWVARLVCSAFKGEPSGAVIEIRHLDGNKQNNVICNLTWGTRAENAEDRRRHGTMPLGDRHANSKLTDAQVAAIRASAEQTKAGRRALPYGWLDKTALAYGVSYGCVQSITSGWRR